MAATAQPPQFTLYTNHGCGWCHRVHITLKELGVPYEEVLLNLREPRPEWYLKLNPRGLVPTLHVKTDTIDEYLMESTPIVEFLTELYPSHLTPYSGNALVDGIARHRQRFFVDTFFTKMTPLLYKLMSTSEREGQMKLVDDFIAHVEKEIEPNLVDANPFFGGSKTITVVEAMCMPFVMLIEDMGDDVVWPAALRERMLSFPNCSTWYKAGLAHESVLDKVTRESRKVYVLKTLDDLRNRYKDK